MGVSEPRKPEAAQDQPSSLNLKPQAVQGLGVSGLGLKTNPKPRIPKHYPYPRNPKRHP